MDDSLPSLPMTQDHLNYLIAALLVYQQYRLKKTPPSEERTHTLLILAFLLPKLQHGLGSLKEVSLPLTVDEVSVIKGGLSQMIDHLKRRPALRGIAQEIARLKQLKTQLEQHFTTTQD